MVIDGGRCSIFELLAELKNACGPHKQLAANLSQNLKPDFLYEKDQLNNMALLEYCCLKIIKKIAIRGLGMKAVFDSWDNDGSGHCKFFYLLKVIVYSGCIRNYQRYH